MYGEEEEALDGTQLAADWTFSGLQKFGQAFIDRLRGKRLPNKILEKVSHYQFRPMSAIDSRLESEYSLLIRTNSDILDHNF